MYGSDPQCSKCGKRITDLKDVVMDALKLCCRACALIAKTIAAPLTEIAERVKQPRQIVLITQAAA